MPEKDPNDSEIRAFSSSTQLQAFESLQRVEGTQVDTGTCQQSHSEMPICGACPDTLPLYENSSGHSARCDRSPVIDSLLSSSITMNMGYMRLCN